MPAGSPVCNISFRVCLCAVLLASPPVTLPSTGALGMFISPFFAIIGTPSGSHVPTLPLMTFRNDRVTSSDFEAAMAMAKGMEPGPVS